MSFRSEFPKFGKWSTAGQTRNQTETVVAIPHTSHDQWRAKLAPGNAEVLRYDNNKCGYKEGSGRTPLAISAKMHPMLQMSTGSA